MPSIGDSPTSSYYTDIATRTLSTIPEESFYSSAESITQPIFIVGRQQNAVPNLFRKILSQDTYTLFESTAFEERDPYYATMVSIDPKVFFANERTFLAWLHMAVLLAGASIAVVSLTDADPDKSLSRELSGVVLLPISVAFSFYAMSQCKYCIVLCPHQIVKYVVFDITSDV